MKSFSLRFFALALAILLCLTTLSLITLDVPLENYTHTQPSAQDDISKVQSSLDAGNFNKKIIEYEYNFNYNIFETSRWGETWELIELDDGIYNSIPGQPQVPYKSLLIELGSEITNVELLFTELVELNHINIPPAPEPEFIIAPITLQNDQSIPIGDQTEEHVGQRINDYHSLDTYYPEQDHLLTRLDTSEVGGEIIFRYSLQIHPCKFNPNLQIAQLYQHVKVLVYYIEPAPIPMTDFATRTASTGTNPSGQGLGQNIDYLILTTEPLLDELAPLAAWKTRQGLNTKIVDINSIYENESFVGYDEPEEIRNYVRYMYNTHGTKYLLLAGDYDTVPPRMCEDPDPYAGADDGEIPSDSYYACISEGSTWDVDNDHIYGELGDLDDIYPDVAVGRIAINSELKMTAWVNEILNYEHNPGLEEWTSKVILLGPNVHNEGDGAEQNEYFYDKYLKYIYDSFDKFYESSDAGNKPFSKAEMINSINHGTTFLNYLGHGGPTVWTYNYGYNVLFDKGDVNRFNNGGMKPVVYAMSCLTEWFDDSSDSGYGNFGDCIGETFTENIDNGGIGYIGSARTSVGSIGNGYQPFATGLQEDFIRQLSQYNFILGNTFTEGKKHYSESFGNLFPDTRSSGEVQACWLEVNLLGDPTLPLWTQLPQKFNITNETREDSVIITVRNETGHPIPDAQVALQAVLPNGELGELLVKKTTSNGEVIFDVYGLPVHINLTVTKINFIPYLETLTLRDMVPPITQLTITPSGPDGENDWYITTPIINLTPDEEGATYYYWDNDNNSEYSQLFFEPILVPEGAHILYYYSIDLAKNTEDVKEFYIKVDLTGPECLLKLDPAQPDGQNGWYIHQPKINITSEPGATIFYSFDDDLNLTFPGSLLAPEGNHKLHFYSKDDAGNLGECETVTLSVDITPPVTDLNLDPKLPSGLNSWYVTAPTITLTTEEYAQIFYYWNTQEENITYLYTDPIICPEGINELHYYSIDFAGCMEKPRSRMIKLDTVGPISEYELLPAEPDGESGFYISDVFITLHSEPNSTIYYHWDNEKLNTYSKSIQGREGTHILTYYSRDDAGNIGESSQLELKIDTTKPETEIKVTPEDAQGMDGWYTTTPKVTFQTDPGAIVYYHFEYDLDSEANSEIEVPEGVNKIYYHSVDEAGNVGPMQWQEFKVDITAPKAKVDTNLLTYQLGEIIVFDASRSIDNFELKSYYIDFGDGTNSGWISYNEIKHIYQKPGEYEVRVRVRDEAGLENERVESVTLLVVKDEEASSYFSMDNMLFIIIIIAAVFIVLSTLFISVHRSYRYRNRAARMAEYSSVIEQRAIVSPIDDSVSEYDYEPAEAIILDKSASQKIKKIKCTGCGTIFACDPTGDIMKCPGCGLKGEMKTKSGKTDTIKVRASIPDKFKCPKCETIFRIKSETSTPALVKCPSCGVTGEIG